MSRMEAETEQHGVDVAGPPDAPPIVFVHGVVMQRKMWAPQRNALSNEFRVVAVDLPGHGTRSGEDFQMEQAVELVEDVFETGIDPSAILVGLSLGGYVATEYARRHPSDVDGLVVSGSSANPVGGLEAVTRLVGGVARLSTRSERIDRALRSLTERWVRGRDLEASVEEEIVDAQFYPEQFGVAASELAGRDVRTGFAAYPGPALVLNGEMDAINRRGEQEHAAAAAAARIEVIDDVGHVCNLEDSASFTDAVRRFSRDVLDGRASSGTGAGPEEQVGPTE